MRAAGIGVLFAAGLGVAACATYYDEGYGRGPRGGYGGYDYSGGAYDRLGNDCRFFRGSGGRRLDPWLACTDEGREVVRRFDQDRDRRIGRATADRANIWFRRHADTNRDMRLTDAEIRTALVNAARWDAAAATERADNR
jgi:hypothetical protein